MKAIDTVISLSGTNNKSLQVAMEGILREQAEISFNAGIKEVVEAIKYPLIHAKESTPSKDCPECQRQSKLKEWGC